MQSITEEIHSDAKTRANPEGIAELKALRTDRLQDLEHARSVRDQRAETCTRQQKRHNEINDESVLATRDYRIKEIGKLDDGIDANGPVMAHVARLEQARLKMLFTTAMLERLVSYRMPLAQLELERAEVEVDRTLARLKQANATLALAEKLMLLAPAAEAEGELLVSGGKTDRLIEECMRSFEDYARRWTALQEHELKFQNSLLKSKQL